MGRFSSLRRDQNGFVLSAVALLLVLPAFLLTSSYLGIVVSGGEASSLKASATEVRSTGRKIGDTLRTMEDYDMDIAPSTLGQMESRYEYTSGFRVNIELMRCGGTLAESSYPAENESVVLLEDYPLFGYELDVAVENTIGGGYRGYENLYRSSFENSLDQSISPHDNMYVGADNFKVWLIAGSEAITVEVIRDNGCERVKTDGNAVLVKVRNSSGNIQYQSKTYLRQMYKFE